MKLAVRASPENAEVIRELLSICEVTWVSEDQCNVAVVYDREPSEAVSKTVFIPSSSDAFKTWTSNLDNSIVKRPGRPIFIAATSKINLSITPEESYEASSETFEGTHSPIVLRLDVIAEFKRRIRQTLGAKSSFAYRLATSSPLPYNIAPQGLRNYFMKRHCSFSTTGLGDILPIDALRIVLMKAIETAAREKLRRKTWRGKTGVCILTHDVETGEGLKRAASVKRLEEKYDLPSAWFLPSKQYPLNKEIIEKLENNGEVGSHDTKHDGKLVHLGPNELMTRLHMGKNDIEQLTKRTVEGFRAPLLQHTERILLALQKCGFKYDTSIPTWEPRHPRTMKPHGIGTVFPVRIEGMLEMPISLVQDHQLLHIVGLTPKEAMAQWHSNLAKIKELGGFCVFLSHPEYDILKGQGVPCYEELLNTITSDSGLLSAAPKDILIDLY